MTTRKPKLRLLSALLAMAMLFTLIPAGAVTAWADDGKWLDDLGINSAGIPYKIGSGDENINNQSVAGNGWSYDVWNGYGDMTASTTDKVELDFSTIGDLTCVLRLSDGRSTQDENYIITLTGGRFKNQVAVQSVKVTGGVFEDGINADGDRDATLPTEIAGGVIRKYNSNADKAGGYITGGIFLKGSGSICAGAHGYGEEGFVIKGGTFAGEVQNADGDVVVAGGVFAKEPSGSSWNNGKVTYESPLRKINVDGGKFVAEYAGTYYDISDQLVYTCGEQKVTVEYQSTDAAKKEFAGWEVKKGDTVVTLDANEEKNPVATFTIPEGTASDTEEYTIKAKEEDKKEPISADDFTFKAPADLVYDGSRKEATVTPNETVGTVGKITKKYYKIEDNTETLVEDANGNAVAPTDPGTYRVKIDVEGNQNYKAAADLTADGWTFTIGKALQEAKLFEYTPPENLIYDGQPKNATVTVKSEYIGKVGKITDIRYCKVGTGEKVVDANGKPTAPVDVGSYYVLLFADAGTHYTNAPGWHVYNWSFNILPADLTADDFELANGTVSLKDDIKGAGTVKRQYKLLDKDGNPTGGYLDELPTDEGGVYQIYVTADVGKNYNALTDPATKKEWTITVDGKDRDLKGGGFTATVDGKESGTAKWGQTVEIEPSDIPTGKKFDHWELSGATLDKDANQPKNSFVMGNSEVTITPKYKDIEYTLTVDGKEESHIYGEDISVTAPKKDGYKFKGWEVSGAEAADKTSENLSFKMPAGNVTLTPQYEKVETPSKPDKPSKPETPDKPNTPDKPSEPEKPDTPDKPSKPEEPKPVVSTINIDNGKAYGEDGETEINTAEAGQKVIVKVNPEAITDGFEFDKWEVVKGDVTLDDETSPETGFVMPAGEVELKVILKVKEVPAQPLTGLEKAAVTATGAVVVGAGAAAVGWSAYNIGTELYLKWVLPQGIIPATRGQLALLLWDKDDPTPVDSSVVYSDINSDDTDLQAAARWVIATGKMELLDDNKPDVFDPDAPVDIFAVAKAWRRK